MEFPKKVLLLSVQELRREEWQEEMFLFVVTTNLFDTHDNIPKKRLPKKYEEFVDVFDKVNVITLP